jgi:hypothetical protein
VEEAVEEEGDEVGARLPALMGGYRRHHLGAGFSNEPGYRNDLIAVIAEGFNERREGRYRYGTVASAVVQKNDGASVPRLRLHFFNLLKDSVDDLFGSLAGVFVPVVGVDLVADDDVAEALNSFYRSGLIVGIGFLIDGVRGAEVKGLDAKLGGEEPLRQVQLQIDLSL